MTSVPVDTARARAGLVAVLVPLVVVGLLAAAVAAVAAVTAWVVRRRAVAVVAVRVVS